MRFSHPSHRPRGYTPVRRWQPLNDTEWDALLPYVLVQNGPGRPLRDARKRMDAIFWTAAAGSAWHATPPHFGKADTVSRHFRRLTHAGLWERLLRALHRLDCPPALRAIEHWIVRACRRATRVRGLGIIVLARRLGFASALRGPSWYLPDPDLSEHVRLQALAELDRVGRAGHRALRMGFFDLCAKLFRTAAGRRRIHRSLEPV